MVTHSLCNVKIVVAGVGSVRLLAREIAAALSLVHKILQVFEYLQAIPMICICAAAALATYILIVLLSLPAENEAPTTSFTDRPDSLIRYKSLYTARSVHALSATNGLRPYTS